MAEFPFYDENNGTAQRFFNSPLSLDTGRLEGNIPLQASNGPLRNSNGAVEEGNVFSVDEQQITESLDRLSTNNDENSCSESDDDIEFSNGQIRKRVRVGNHYQARIPKFLTDMRDVPPEGQLLWSPHINDPKSVEDFLHRISSLTKNIIPMGTHLRDDEQALYILLQSNYDIETAFNIINTRMSSQAASLYSWTEEECRSFEKGLVNYGKNFLRIQRNRVTSRSVGELVQFYYLWKKTERYDLLADKIRSGKKKYLLNPGISDLMARYLKKKNFICDSPDIIDDVQSGVTEKIVQSNPQY